MTRKGEIPRALRRTGRRNVLRSLLTFVLGNELTYGARGSGHATGDRSGDALILWHGARDIPQVALTFDDCFHLDLLHRLEELLGDNPWGRVTFFPVGTALEQTARRDAELWGRLVASGHEIGYHTYDHRHPDEMTAEELSEDYQKWLEACKEAVGEEPVVLFARPPYGECSQSFRDLCAEQGLVLAMWSKDWSRCAEGLCEKVEKAEPGDIVVMHVSSVDVRNVGEVLSVLEERSLQVVTLSRLYSATNKLPGLRRVREAQEQWAFLPRTQAVVGRSHPRTLESGVTLSMSEQPSLLTNVKAVKVAVVPVSLAAGGWATDVVVTIANEGEEIARNLLVVAYIERANAPGSRQAAAYWLVRTLAANETRVLHLTEVEGGSTQIVLAPGRYQIMVEVSRAEGRSRPPDESGPDSNTLGPLPFQILSGPTKEART